MTRCETYVYWKYIS